MPPFTNPALEPAQGAGMVASSAPALIFRSPAWAEISRLIDAHRQWTEQRHMELTAIPAPTFHESARAEWMAGQFRSLGLKSVRLDEVGNVLGERPGASRGRVWVTAHLDTVFSADANVQVARDGRVLRAPGIGDNGAGLSALLTLVSVLQQSSAQTNLGIRFVANVGEEGEGDLRGMRHLFSGAEARRNTAAVLVLDGPGAEHITNAALGSRRFLIEVSGPGGHSWNDFGRVNPIHALAAIIRRIETIPLPMEPRTTISVGIIEGGTTINSIPQSAWIKVDIRSTSMAQIEVLTFALHEAIDAGVSAEMERAREKLVVRTVMLGERPAAAALDHSRLLEAILQADQLLGIRGSTRCSSTDANIPLAQGIDALTVGGGGDGGGAHTLEEWYDPQGRELALKRVLLTLLATAGVVKI